MIGKTTQNIWLYERVVCIVATFQNALAETADFEFPIGELQDGAIAKTDLLQINHLLVSGATGSGKSVFVDSVLLTLMFHNTPDRMRLILCDTKSTEFLQYNSAGHLFVPVCTAQDKISGVLQWVKSESNKRLQLFSVVGAKSISSYNDRSWEEFRDEMPHIVVIVDDLSTVINSSPEANELIKHILSVGRTVGVHLIAVTQTPTAKYTKDISLLFFSKAIFQTASMTDYRLLTGKRTTSPLNNVGDIFFCNGAFQLQGHTIMPGARDTNNILDSVCSIATKHDEAVMHEIEKNTDEKDRGVGGSEPVGGEDYDELLPVAIDMVLEAGQASVSMLQRWLKLGYGRAARLVDQMEEKGVVGPFEGSKPRQLLITKEQWWVMQHKQEILQEAPTDALKDLCVTISPVDAEPIAKPVCTDPIGAEDEFLSPLEILPITVEAPQKSQKSKKRLLLSVVIFFVSLYFCLMIASVIFPTVDGEIQLNIAGALRVFGVPILAAVFLPKAIFKSKK